LREAGGGVNIIKNRPLYRGGRRQRDFRLFPCGEQRSSVKTGVNWQKPRKRCLSTVRERRKSLLNEPYAKAILPEPRKQIPIRQVVGVDPGYDHDVALNIVGQTLTGFTSARR